MLFTRPFKPLSRLCYYLLLSIGIITAPAQAKTLTEISKAYNQSTSNATMQINSLYELLQYQQNAKQTAKLALKSIEIQARDEAINEYAFNLAIRTAITSQLTKAHNGIMANQRELDSIYNFVPLMIQGKVVPPVITESRNLYNQSGTNQIRLSGAVYDIYTQARFSSVAPNWRDYLVFPQENNAYELIAFGATGFEPKNDHEKEIWVKATIDGWKQGQKQANDIIQNAMDRLNRDYIGMVRFHTFVAQGKVTMPIINSYQLYDSNLGERLILDEHLLELQTLPTFKTPTGSLKSALGSSPLSAVLSSDTLPPRLTDETNTGDNNANELVKKAVNGETVGQETFEQASTKSPHTHFDRPLTINIERKLIVPEIKDTEPAVTTDQFGNVIQEVYTLSAIQDDTIGEPLQDTKTGKEITKELENHQKKIDDTPKPQTQEKRLFFW